ncbi:MAG TPA: heme-binding protein [Magnetospirillaceae bacterium]|jgi:uncharacterized protein GlcG (DUF336 family)
MRIVTAAVVACLIAAVGPAWADDAKPNPLDAIPDKMPFDVPYGAPITLDRANTAIDAAVKEAQKRGWHMNVAVVDAGSNLVAFERMDNAQLAGIEIAQHKARVAARYRRDTKVFESTVQNNIAPMTLDGMIASRGGIPLIKDGKLIGAIGCSGGTGSQDEAVCKAGAAVIGP